ALGHSHSAAVKLSSATLNGLSKPSYKSSVDMFNNRSLQGSILEFGGVTAFGAYLSTSSSQLRGTVRFEPSSLTGVRMPTVKDIDASDIPIC
ncbi:hypothetical protein BGX26_003424, partial [Mortierella sp. AD094]